MREMNYMMIYISEACPWNWATDSVERSADRAYISTTFRALKEIEEGIKHEFIETIQDHAETERLVPKVIRSATEEILLILSTNIL